MTVGDLITQLAQFDVSLPLVVLDDQGWNEEVPPPRMVCLRRSGRALSQPDMPGQTGQTYVALNWTGA